MAVIEADAALIDRGKRSVLGVGVSVIDYEAAVARILGAARNRESMTVTALAVHGIMTGVFESQHKYRLNQFDLVCPDGQPVRWALNSLHDVGLDDRVYGPELTLRICAAAADRGIGIYLFGATAEMLDALTDRLVERFPSLRIAGRRASKFGRLSPAERDELASEINSSGAGICFVGLGCPRQEIFAYEMRDRIEMPQVAVGAAFAFHAGLLEQAPAWMQRHGLEWLFRLSREPGRLWRRYLVTNPSFLTLLAMQKCGLYRGEVKPDDRPEHELLFG